MYRVRGIIFDLDGTLVDLHVDWRRLIKYVERMLGMEVKSLLELYPKIWGTQEYELVCRTVEKFELSSLYKLEILEGSPELLTKLSSRYLLGLATFQGENVVNKILNRLGIRNIIVGTRDHAPTKIGQICHIVSSTSLNPKDFLVVGDRLNDVYSALSVGCQAVLIDRRNKFDPGKVDKKLTVIRNITKLPTLLEE